MKTKENIPVVAIVGRPNVGKSTLFNRLIGRHKAIVERTSGITRDRLYADLSWQKKWFKLVDTGGLDLLSPKGISRAVRDQAKIAICQAQIILFICDVREGIVGLDKEISLLLKKSGKRIFLIVNKADNETLARDSVDFYQLGLNKPHPISAMHGLGIGEILDEIAANFEQPPAPPPIEETIKVAIVGKPNVGKSSFFNYLLNENRVIVDRLPGTTRDSVDTLFRKGDVNFLLIDTAGIHHLRKVKTTVDVYGISRAISSIRRCDVGLVLIDGMEGLRRDDLRILRSVLDEGRGCVIAVNKWDLVKTVPATKYERAIRARAPFVKFAPVVFTSALTGRNVLSAIRVIENVAKHCSQTISTGELNKAMKEIWEANPPQFKYGKEAKFYYAVQIGRRPPAFLIFVNNPKPIRTDYVSYLEGRLRERFNLSGTPISINFRRKK